MAKCILDVCGHQATVAAGNLNLCVGLPARIEGAVHAIWESWEPPEMHHDEPSEEGEPAAANEAGLRTQPDQMVDSNDTAPPEGTGGLRTQPDPQEPSAEAPQAVLLVDAHNGFNELSHRAMLWTVRHCWPAGARFSFNCYRHSAQLIVRQHGRTGHTLLSREGVTQGDPLSMVLYGLALSCG